MLKQIDQAGFVTLTHHLVMKIFADKNGFKSSLIDRKKDNHFFTPQLYGNHSHSPASIHKKDIIQAKDPWSKENLKIVEGEWKNDDQTFLGPGTALSRDLKKFYEPKFGHDFSKVKIHTGANAANAAQSMDAFAYTSGNNIVFNQGQYSPNSKPGKKLVAHELTHVVQNANSASAPIKRKEFSSTGRANEETPSIINAVVVKSDVLKKYVGEDKIKAAFLNSENFNVIKQYELEGFGKKCNQGDINDAGGFFCRSVRNAKDKKLSGDIFVVRYLKLGHVIHEFIHKLSGLTVRNFLGTFINEGVTQYFTDLFLKEGQYDILTDHKYQKNLECANKIIAETNEETLAKSYFNSDTKLVIDLQKLLGLKSINDVKTYFDSHKCIP